MGHSPLLGATSAPLEPDGRDTAALGPGDSSDTGAEAEDADLAFIDDAQATDPLDDEDETGDDETPVDGDAGRPPEKNPVAPPVARSGRRRR